VSLPNTRVEDEHESLDELAELARTAGAMVVDRFVQNRTRLDGKTYIGSGMVERIKAAAEMHDANILVFDDDLRPAQGREIEQAMEIKVIDRTELILDIFARRARTKVARAQVELAQLEYELPRLRRLWDHLQRLGGGIGTRGPGETQLESDRRSIRIRIKMLKKVLEGVEVDRQEQRKRRSHMVRVALVGYTNAGKSTLMNALSGADVLTEDLLFATLDATTRKIELPGGHEALLTDTVGLIKKLPHHLVVSFHATLEEVAAADLLLHVVDVSRPHCERYMDLANAVFASAVKGEGLEDIRRAICAFVESKEEILNVTVPYSEGRLISTVYEMGEVLSKHNGEEALEMRVRVSKANGDRLRKLGVVE